MEADLQHPYLGRVLVVDDEPEVGRLLQDWLTQEGYQARYVATFDDVRRVLEQESIDLVTLDVMMPQVDGLQVLAWISQHHPEVGVLMATAVGNLDTVLAALRGGAWDYLLKPFNLELVSAQLARAMERQRLVAENRAYQSQMERKVAAQLRSLTEVNQQLQQTKAALQARIEALEAQPLPASQSSRSRELPEVQTELGQALAYLQRAMTRVQEWQTEEER